MKDYEINEFTNAIIPINENETFIIEDKREFVISKKAFKILDDSCKYFGSSYQGRFEGAKRILGAKIYKAPIIVEETQEMIYFPTSSSRLEDCAWIALKKVDKIKKSNYKTNVFFKSNKEYEFDISFESFHNQLLRASRLDSILKNRKKEK